MHRSDPAGQRAVSSAPLKLASHAIATLEYIRGSIDNASSYAVPGSPGVAMGGIGLVTGMAATFAYSLEEQLALWLAASAVAFATCLVLMYRQARSVGRSLYYGAPRKFFLCLTPSLAAGALLTFV